MNFQEWHDEADMPHYGENGWVDLETGFLFRDMSHATVKEERKELSKTARDSREYAKFFGAKALTGSRKQKEWAEKIRKSILEKCESASTAELFCSDQLKFFKTSKFWIENRQKSPSELLDIVNEYSRLRAWYMKSYSNMHSKLLDQEKRIIDPKLSKLHDDAYENIVKFCDENGISSGQI